MSNDKIFRIDFYPKDWLLDTAQLPPDERGIYIQIICLIYAKGGPIDNDPRWISGVSGCTPRMAKGIVDKLLEKKFLTLNSDGQLTQKRAESELKQKRNHLEISSKGGRKSSENSAKTSPIPLENPAKTPRVSRENHLKTSRVSSEHEYDFNENNNLSSSDDMFSVPTTTPPHPTPSPSPSKHLTPTPTPDPREQGGGVFENGKGEGGVSAPASPPKAKTFNIEFHLTDDDREAAREAAPGWDMHHLMRIYNEGVPQRGVPNAPAKAFLAWLPRYTKGKQP